MHSAVVNSSELAKSGRWDAKYHVLLAEHAPLAEELATKFDAVELLKLIDVLPYDQRAADAVFGRSTPMTRSALQVEVGRQRDSKLQVEVGRQRDSKLIRDQVRWRQTLAVYVAAASHYAVSKVLEEIAELKKREAARLNELCGVLDLAREKGATALLASLKDHTEKENG